MFGIKTIDKNIAKYLQKNQQFIRQDIDSSNLAQYLRKELLEFSRLKDIPYFPNEVYICGGSMSALFRDPKYMQFYHNSDIDMFILGSIRRKKEIASQIIAFYKNLYSCVYVASNYSVIYLIIIDESCPRLIQLVLSANPIMSILQGFDFSHLRFAFDGHEFIGLPEAIEAVTTLKTTHHIQYSNRDLLPRVVKTLRQGFTITNSTSPELIHLDEIQDEIQDNIQDKYFKLVMEKADKDEFQNYFLQENKLLSWIERDIRDERYINWEGISNTTTYDPLKPSNIGMSFLEETKGDVVTVSKRIYLVKDIHISLFNTYEQMIMTNCCMVFGGAISGTSVRTNMYRRTIHPVFSKQAEAIAAFYTHENCEIVLPVISTKIDYYNSSRRLVSQKIQIRVDFPDITLEKLQYNYVIDSLKNPWKGKFHNQNHRMYAKCFDYIQHNCVSYHECYSERHPTCPRYKALIKFIPEIKTLQLDSLSTERKPLLITDLVKLYSQLQNIIYVLDITIEKAPVKNCSALLLCYNYFYRILPKYTSGIGFNSRLLLMKKKIHSNMRDDKILINEIINDPEIAKIYDVWINSF